MAAKKKELLRSLPSISTMLEHEDVCDWLTEWPRSSVVEALQCAISETREAMLDGTLKEEVDEEDLLARAEETLYEQSIPSLRRVINATGIVLHTGLGRAPLSDAAIEAVAEGAAGYCSLEYDLSSGRRGKRNSHIAERLATLTGAEAATIVNNNAAATLLILQVFAKDKEAIVSRGQLIEIGGSFRLPDIMSASGATLKEVGTTNRTRIVDYERAINDRTAMLMHVHPSNYRVVGFTEDTPLSELSELAHRYGLIALDDLGSGSLFDLTPYGLPAEPFVSESLSAGADLVCFSGDKLLGGPQCGLIVGKSDLIEQLESHPLMRTYRVDKMTLIALDATLRACVDPEDAIKHIPTLGLLTASTDELARHANTLAEQLQAALPDEHFLVCSDTAYAGGGSMPARELETVIVQWRPATAPTQEIASSLRESEVPVIARVRDDAICFDLRTLRDPDFEALVGTVTAAVNDENPDDAPENA